MRVKRLSKRFLKILGILVGSLLVLLTIFHFWFVNHAEELVQNLVSLRSDGKVHMKVGNFKFNWFSKKMSLEDAVFYSTDSVTTNTSYRFYVKKINLKVKAVLPMIFEKRVLISLLSLKEPDIVVTKLRSNVKDTTDKFQEDISIPREVGRIYNSIQDALTVLQVKKFEIKDARFSLINRANPKQYPVYITNIDFDIDNLRVDSTDENVQKKILFSDNIILKTKDQDILFPDGRHKLSFSKFRINIEKKIVELDSCTIAAIKTDSSSAAFSIFFDQLKLTNINFDTLYHTEVIKADSVYALNARFKLDVDLDMKKGKRGPPKLDRIIQQLFGDLRLNYVVVNNAAFNINTLRNDKVNSFTSDNNNFEIQGLNIDKEAEKPLRVEKFAMAIRNYQTFLRDSSYEMKFDSVLFDDDKIFLSNYSFTQVRNGKRIKHFLVPRFQLIGLSWDDLLFENRLTAQQAVLYDPHIYYVQDDNARRRSNRKNLFEVIAGINEFVMLEDLQIKNGDIEAHINGSVAMKLENATLSIESRSLLGSQELSAIRRSVNQLDFTKGYFKFNDFTILLDKINYTGTKSQLHAETVRVSNRSSTVNAIATDVVMDQVFVNEFTGDVDINGITWARANIKLDPLIGKGANENGSVLRLSNINVRNTEYSSAGNKKIHAFFERLSAKDFLLLPAENPTIIGLDLLGHSFSFRDGGSSFKIDKFEVRDKYISVFNDVQFYQSSGSVSLSIPQVSFIPDVQSIIDGKIKAGNATLSSPVASFIFNNSNDGESAWLLPQLALDKLLITEPRIDMAGETVNGPVKLNWNGKDNKNNSLLMTDIVTDRSGFSARQLMLDVTNFVFIDANGKKIDAGQGEVLAQLEDISLSKPVNEPLNWKASIATLEGKNFSGDSLGKRNGRLEINSVQLKELAIGSAFKGIRQLLKENKRFRLQQITGSYINDEHKFNWYNAVYDKNSRSLTLDSFKFNPAVSRDSFITSHPYQVDYLNISTGPISIGPFDLEKYLDDTTIRIGTLKAENIYLSDYRDNRSPFRKGILKPLVANRIKDIPVRFSIDTILVTQSKATYTEVNAMTKQSGTVPISLQSIKIFPVKNYDLTLSDSLRIQANGTILDSIHFRLRLRQSYLDTNAGFLMAARIQGADMRILNSILPQFAAIRIESGTLDSIAMRVSGGEYLANGKMDMHYRDLKIRILPREGQSRFFISILNFIANSFVIKNNNERREGKVFFVRDREKSSFNYLVKLLMSGVASSTGAKRNRKLERIYKKELSKRNLPSADYD